MDVQFSVSELRVIYYAVDDWLDYTEEFVANLQPDDPGYQSALHNLEGTRQLHAKLKKIITPFGFVE